MNDQKDRFGDKIHDLEKVREDQWARERDQVLLEKLRARQRQELHCPQCDAQLMAKADGNITIEACPNGHGAWLAGEALEHLIGPKK
jgi:Transcription factor zinc-finger